MPQKVNIFLRVTCYKDLNNFAQVYKIWCMAVKKVDENNLPVIGKDPIFGWE